MPAPRRTAVVLAGGGPTDRLAAATGAPSKALVPLAGRPLGEFVLAALRASSVFDDIVFVGETYGQFEGLFDAQVPGGRRLVDSLALGLGAALARGAPSEVVLVTADVPWLTPEAVARFVTAAGALRAPSGEEAQFVYPVVAEADAKAQFPAQKRTYARLAEGRFTGGNLVYLRAAAVPQLLPFIDRVFRSRKNPLALAGLVGGATLARFVSGSASLPALEARVGALLGVPVRALPTSDACVAADVDGPDQLPGTASHDLPVPAPRSDK